MIYFIKSGKFVKIGYSNDVHRRLRDLQTSTPTELHLLGSFYGTLKIERYIHNIFAESRVRGEWFNLTDDIIDFVNKYDGLDKESMPAFGHSFHYGDIVMILSGKYAGKYGSVMTSQNSSTDVMVGLRDRNSDWMHTFIIQSIFLSMIQQATPTDNPLERTRFAVNHVNT